MIQYLVRASNANGGFTSTFDTLHDAEVSLNAIREVNQCLNESGLTDMLFTAWITKWEGYTLEDGSKVTVSAEQVALLTVQELQHV